MEHKLIDLLRVAGWPGISYQQAAAIIAWLRHGETPVRVLREVLPPFVAFFDSDGDESLTLLSSGIRLNNHVGVMHEARIAVRDIFGDLCVQVSFSN